VSGKLRALELRLLRFIEVSFWDLAVETAEIENQEGMHEVNQVGVE